MYIRNILLENGKTWSVSCLDDAYVNIPTSQIAGMSDEEIGAMVRSLKERAEICMVYEAIGAHDNFAVIETPVLQQFIQIIENYMKTAINDENERQDVERMEKFRHDILTILKRRAAKEEKARKLDENNHLEEFIYLLHNRRNGFYKIGRSKNPLFREKTLQSEEPDVQMVSCWSATRKTESMLHKQFKEKRLRGEWFALNQDDIEWIVETMQAFNREANK